MLNLRTAAFAATSGFALMALPTPASANTVRCEFVASAPITVNNTTSAAITNTTAVENAIASPEGQRRLANSPPECRQAVVTASLQQSRLNPTGMVAPNTTVSVSISIPRILPSPAAPAEPAAPANVGGAPSGGGAMLDARDNELSRRIAALEAGGGNSTEIAALRADLASLRAERPQASQPVVRNTTRVVRETRVINQGLNGEDRSNLDSWTKARKSITDTLGRLFGTGEDNPQTEAREDGIIGGLKAADAESDRRHDATEATLENNGWLIYLALALGLISLLWASILQRSKASKKEVRTSVVISDESRKALDAAADGVKVPVELFERGERYCTVEFEKAPDGSFHPTADIGDTNAGTPVRDVEAFLRRCYWQRRAVLNDFR